MQDDTLKEFYDIGKSLSSEKDTLKLFEKIISSSLKLTGADAGTIYLVIDKKDGSWSYVKNGSIRGKLLKFVIARNNSMDVHLEDFTAPISNKSIFGFSVISGKSLIIEDAYGISPDVEYSHNHSFDENTGYRTISLLTIPMKNHDDNVTGVIQLLNKKRADKILPFNSMDELIMNSLAGQAAVALENNLLYRDMQRLLHEYKQQNNHLVLLSKKILKADEEERRRIAREIHDGPAQSAVNLSFKLEICKRYLSDKRTEELSSELNNLGGLVHSNVNEIRTIIYDLKPSCLENGLISAIGSHIEVFSQNTGLNITYKHRGRDSKVEYYLTSTIYRILQEALSNVNKHASAQNVAVNLAVTEDSIQLSISDDGMGFDPEGLKARKFDKLKGGFGLEGIRERIELVRGVMEIASAPGKGTTLTLKIPIY